MNYKQFSTIQRYLGKLDGLGFGLDVFTRPVYLSVLRELSSVIEELRPEIEESGGKSAANATTLIVNGVGGSGVKEEAE